MPLLVTLGRFELIEPDSGTPLIPAGKPLALLAWLALGDQQQVSRDQAAQLLWDTLPLDRARHSLRQAVLVLRRVLGEDALVTSRTTLRLATTVDSDHNQFLVALHQGDHATALRLYRGDFLTDVSIPGGTAFDNWASQQRARLQEACIAAATTHFGLLISQDQGSDALSLALGLREQQPREQAAWRLVIEAHLHLDNLAAVRQESAELERWLTATGTTPDAATRALLSRLSGSVPAEDSKSRLDDPALVGRDAEFSMLVAAWRRVRPGNAELVHVTGEAGIGKSRLLTAIADRLVAFGANVARIRITPGGRELQRVALASTVDTIARLNGAKGIDPTSAEALVSLVPALEQVFSASRRAVGPPGSHWLVAACVDLLGALSSDAPFALIIDDLHWADPESLDILGAAIARCSDQPLLVVTSSRHDSPLPGTLPGILPLAPLTIPAVAELLTSLGDGDEPRLDELAAILHQSSNGNPLLVIEALRSLLAAGAVSLSANTWQVGSDDAIRSVIGREVPLLQRIRRLGATEEQVLTTLAVSGHPLSESVLLQVEPAAGPALAALELAGLATLGPHGWEVSHDRFAERLLDQLSATDIATRRSALAAAMLRGEVGPAELVVALSHARAGGGRHLLQQVATRWIAWHRQSGVRTPTRTLLEQLAVASGDRFLLPQLRSAMPLSSRLSFRLGVVAAVALMIAIPIASWRRSIPDYSLRLEQEPSIDWMESELAGARRFVAPISLAAYGPDGSNATDARDTLTLRVIGPSRARLSGDTVVVMQDGRATFSDVLVHPEGEDSVTLAVFHPRAGRIISRRLAANANYGAALHLLSGTLNGQEIDPSDPRVVVAASDTISGRLRFNYRSDWKHAVVIFCGLRTWLPRDEGVHEFESIQTPMANGKLDRPIAIPAPAEPGEYTLIFAFRAERNCPLLASFTNWTLDKPNWDDGPDLAHLTDQQLELARRQGFLDLPLHQRDLPVAQMPYAVQSITVVVR